MAWTHGLEPSKYLETPKKTLHRNLRSPMRNRQPTFSLN